MRNKHRVVVLLMTVSILVVFVSLGLAQDNLPDLVIAQHPSLHPEGVEWDTMNNQFLVGSLTEGTIFSVGDDGMVSPFIEDDELISTIGIHIDHTNDRLLVANSDIAVFGDPPSSGIAGLGVYDLVTGDRIFYADLGALLPDSFHFANDIANDADGNAYVTDTMAATIYKVDADGNASVFLQSDEFINENFGLNGIEYHPDGYLLVAVTGSGAFYKVPLENPDEFTQVTLDEPIGGDGMIFHADGSLIVVGTTFNDDGSSNSEVLSLHSEDDWSSATVMSRVPTDPALSATTATIRDNGVYVVHAHFNALFFGGDPVDAFEILLVDLASTQ